MRVLSIDFLVTSLIVVITPGTGVLYTLAAALAHGSRASIMAAIGCTLGIVPHMAAAITGLAAVLHASALAFEVLRYAGVAYLIYMAWMTLAERGALAVRSDPPPRSAARVIVSGVLINILNPKLTIFFFAFLPQFVRADDPVAAWHMLELSAVFMLMTLLVFVAYGLMASAARRHMLERPRTIAWLRRVLAGAFVALGARLALSDR